jgi:release factor glutamine methyltransferase
MAEPPWTVLKLLQWTSDYFTQKGVDAPRASAELLLAHVLSQDRLSLYLNYDSPLEPPELAAFRQCIKRRVAGEPVQYITGSKEFWSLKLWVSPAVLIPRPETEVLVETVVDFVRQREFTWKGVRTIDVGTGSGAIAIALAKELPSMKIVATDLSAAALRLARENAIQHQVDDRIHFVRTDMFAGISGARGGFSVLVANPPYVSHAEFPELPREVRDFEPRYALDGGADGLAVIRHIVAQAPPILQSSGALFMEMGAGQAERVIALVRSTQQYRQHRVIKDYSGIDRILVAEKR